MAGVEMASFGDLLRRHRDRLGLTQEELAERAGLSAVAVSLLERGERRRPQRYTVQRLAGALDLSPADRLAFERAARADGGGAAPTAAIGEARPTSDPGAARLGNLPAALTSFV